MTASAPDPRHRAVELLEEHLAREGIAAPAHLARTLISRLEAAGLVVHDAVVQRSWGRCEFHQSPLPCGGCAADRKAKPDETPGGA